MAGFSFSNWSLLSDDIKKKVINLLDYESRCSLRSCSKSEQSLVDSTEFRASKGKLEEIECPRVTDKTIIRIDIDTFSVWFIGKNDVTRVERGWNGEVSSEFSQLKLENRHTVAKCFLETLFLKGPLSADAVCIESLDYEPQDNWILDTQTLHIRYVSHANAYIWLENLRPQNKYKSIRVTGLTPYDDRVIPTPFPSKILKVTDSLHLGYLSLMSDEQFDAIEAVDLDVSLRNVSPGAVKRKLQKFLKEGRKKDRFEVSSAYPNGFKFTELLPEDVTFRELPPEIYEEDGKYMYEVHGEESRMFGVEEFYHWHVVTCYVKDKHEHSMWH